MFAQKENADSEVQPEESGLIASSANGPLDLLITRVNQCRMENCANKNFTVLSSEINAEPDSSVAYADDTGYPILKKFAKSQCDTVKTDSLCPDSVGVDEGAALLATISASRLDAKSTTQLGVESSLENSDVCKNYVGSLRPGCSVITEPIETSIIQNVSKVTKNFTLNVNSNVNIQEVVQSVSGGNQTLWLPTIIAPGNVANSEDRLYEEEGDPPTTISQIFLTGTGQHYSSHTVNNSIMTTSKQSHVSNNNKFPPKVQILGSITIPKPSSMTNTSQSNIKMHANYLSQNDISNINSSVLTSPSKQIIGNTVINQTNSKIHPTNIPVRGPPVHVKSVINSTNLQMKGISPGNINRSLNKVNSVNNKLESTQGSGIITGQSNHVHSRVLPSPKISLQPTGRVMKSGNIQYNAKPPGNMDQSSNIMHTHKLQSAVPVKIIQQQSLQPSHKTGFKTVQTSRPAIGSSKNLSYSSVNTLPPKTWSQVPNSSLNQVVNQKQAPTYTKNISGVVNVQKISQKIGSQKMVVHQPSNQIIMQNPTQVNRINAQHYQSCDTTGGAIRYIQNYVGLDNNNSTPASSNQNITAQILQSLSQPKILMPSQHLTTSKRSTISRTFAEDGFYYRKSSDQSRQMHGDPNTVMNTDDIPGIEERPSLSDDSLPFHYHTLQLVMLDHTYALPSQTISSTPANGPNVVANNTSPVNTMILPSPSSPTKVVTLSSISPVNGALSGQLPVTSMPVILPNNTSTIIQNSSNYQYNLPSVEDDDAASIISSIEGDRDIERSNERHDSDTDTAPEGEEEGKTRCVCEFTHDDGYMICCDNCGEWQHVDCMGIDRQNIPDDYMCDRCQPRPIDRKRARSIQIRKREELTGMGSSGSDSSSGASIGHQRNKQVLLGVSASSARKRPLTVTTYSNTISGVSRTVPAFPATFSPPYDTPNTSPLQIKRGPKRPRRIDNGRKGPKRKIPEKRKRKNSEISNYRSKYGSLSTSSHQVNQWTDSFELAVTNHYSPELRAKIARYCSNKSGNNPANMTEILNAYFCTTVPHAGSKILIATEDLKENTPIVELRGKYMLSTQHKPQPQLSGRVGSQRPGPFLFFYRLPKDSTQICIDTRTYGNEARFVRRSCNPNSELQHFIHKGALHVYLVTLSHILSNTEITILHESNGSAQPCACGNPKYCKQGGGVTTPVVHKNNGAAFDSVTDRKGRTRLSSSSFSIDHVGLNSPTKYDEFPKLNSPDNEKLHISEMEVDIKQEFVEHSTPEKLKEEPVKQNFIVSPKIDKICAIEEVKPKIEDEPVIKKIDLFKAEVEIKEMKKEEIKIEVECQPAVESNVVLPISKEEEDDEEDEEDDDDDDEPLSKIECKNMNASATKATPIAKSKETDKPKKGLTSRRTSTHCTRTTRASSMMAMNTNESADEKSDSQSDSKSHQQSTKEKKKMTREERKMEAIMKAFERMEKAELRKQENKDRQSKRRESDTNQPCGNISMNDSKDQNDDQMDDSSEQTIKRRRRKKGRIRTVSQNNQRNRNRLNSIDSDMVTSGEESTSLLSPSNNSNNAMNDNYSEPVTMASCEDTTHYQDQALSDTASLQQSVRRLNVGLSSACLLVEAAVGPLENTFKFPKTKKDIMNAWLSKSPERHLSYDINHSLDYSTANDNNNSPHPYINNKSLSRDLSLEYIMKATKNLMGNYSGGAISNESTPEKNYNNNEQTEPENLSTFDNAVDSTEPGMTSPVFISQKGRKVQNEIVNECNSYDKKVPKRFRKGFKGVPDERTSPIKRNLRSSTNLDSTCESNAIPFLPPRDEPTTPIVIPQVRDTEIAIAPQPPQHSAKKRWLRQAISEESDSPTAESPPNEIVTPLKKRRLARESLSLEPPFTNCDEAQFTSMGTPKKIDPAPSFQKISPREGFRCSVPPKMEVICEESISQLESPDIKMSNYENSDEHVLNTLAQEIDHNNDKYFPDSVSESTKESNAIDIDEESKNSQSCNEVNLNKSEDVQSDSTILTDLKINFTNFSRLKRSKDYLDSKDDACIEDIIGVNRDYQESDSREIKSEPVSNIHSAETSGNSSPVVDDIDDIKKRIHSFHTENIQILKIRNKKQPKEKRKVNLNFDLCVLADQTVGVKLKSETDSPKKDGVVSEPKLQTSIEDSSNLDSSSEINTTFDEICLSKSTKTESPVSSFAVAKNQDSPGPQSNNITSPGDGDKGFMCTPLFSGSFKGEPNTTNSPMPDINVIKNAINLTTSLEIGIKSKTILNSVDEYKNVQEILSHVNQMDSHNSLLLSGVLRDSNHTMSESATLNKPLLSRSNDPRLNPPPVEKPKPQRRKLSISEYRRRHSMVSTSSTEQDTSCGSISPGVQQNTYSSTADSSTAMRTFNASDEHNPDSLQSNENLLESLHSDKNECSNLDSNASSSGCVNKQTHCATTKLPPIAAHEAQAASQSVNISFLNTSPQIRSAR